MRKNIISYAAAITVLFASCSESLDDINKNPNATEAPNPVYLLTGAEKNGADLYWGSAAGYGGTLLFVQHWAAIQYGSTDRYDITNTDGSVTTLWNTSYTNIIASLNSILALDDKTANSNCKGAALTLRSWVFLLLTDSYGDIPYTEAGKSITPLYDAQQNVYAGLQSDLDEALRLLKTDGEKLSGDVVYNGDIAKWRKFAVSLKLRIALRTADREPDKAKQIISSLNLSELIGSNSETFQFVYTSSPYNNPQHAHFVSRNDYRISKTIVDKLKSLNDPRLPVYADLPKDNSTTDYAGGANGLTDEAANNQGFDKISLPGKYFISSAAPAVIYSYAEVLFNLSEAVQRGYISGSVTAQDYYRQAITASLAQFGITDPAIVTAYLSQPAVQYDATNWKKSIGEQKWIAFFGQGLDSFTEWRRLDYPQLAAGPASVLDGEIPVRLLYPGTEQSLNRKNREAAVARQGADLLTTKLWFDTY
ncbi:MAG: SusD/RagB family nutrient-binding outer membrane lipoprotein [Prevotellaceae bacterium]|nr:SusD/RagB family nutrient-binding outer membrane lipoprotein [Prevotellaceae bacterium]